MKNPKTGLARIIAAGGYSWAGLRSCYKTEAAFREELLACALLLPLGLWLGDGGVEKALLVGSLLLVLIVELLNSAVEAVVDRFGHEYHELSGKAKDIGSAAVLVAIVNAVVVWVCVVLT